MESGMTFFNRHKSPATSRANFSAAGQCPIDNRAVPFRLNHFRGEKNRRICRRGAQQLDRVICRNRAGRPIFTGLVHQMPGRRPIAVAIEERPDDAAIQDSGKRFVARLRFPFRDDFFAAHKTANVEALRIRRATPKAGIFRRVFFLEGLRFSVRHRHFAPLAAEPG